MERFSVTYFDIDFNATYLGEGFTYTQAHQRINKFMEEKNRPVIKREVSMLSPIREEVLLSTIEGRFFIDKIDGRNYNKRVK